MSQFTGSSAEEMISVLSISNSNHEKESKWVKTFELAVVHEEMNPRKRFTMEDCHRIIPNLYLNGNTQYAYFSVYDGHGGRQIVDFLEENLENNIVKELKEPDDALIPERLSRAYLITDMESKKLGIATSGATAISALLKTVVNDDGLVLSRTLYTANAGDSRAVLCHQNSDDGLFYARRLSFDHRCEDESEQKRIKDAGGFITRSRVLGILAVTRSFGDHGMKEFVSAEPYVSETFLGLQNISHGQFSNPFLILACDGVWDVFSDQEAVDLIMKRYQYAGPFPEAAELLVKEALTRGSTDNITAIVIFL